HREAVRDTPIILRVSCYIGRASRNLVGDEDARGVDFSQQKARENTSHIGNSRKADDQRADGERSEGAAITSLRVSTGAILDAELESVPAARPGERFQELFVQNGRLYPGHGREVAERRKAGDRECREG